MIKAFGTTEGGRGTLVLTVTERNLEQLKLDNPIHILKEQMEGVLPFDIIIMYGKDDKELVKIMRGSIDEKTVIHDETQRKKQ